MASKLTMRVRSWYGTRQVQESITTITFLTRHSQAAIVPHQTGLHGTFPLRSDATHTQTEAPYTQPLRRITSARKKHIWEEHHERCRLSHFQARRAPAAS